jgi:hypothetical protein
MSANFNNTTPAAPAGFQNALWQEDGSGDISCYMPSDGGVSVKTAGYTLLAGDCGKLLVFNAATSGTFQLPAAIPFAQWAVFVANESAAVGSPPTSPVLTLSPNGLNLDGGAASISLYPGQGVYIASDGTNYFTSRGIGPTLQNNGTANSSQAVLNLKAGANVTLTDQGGGAISISATGGGGGGSSISYGTYAGLPAAPSTADQMYFCTDVPYYFVSNGGSPPAWLCFLPERGQVTLPPSSWTYVNQNSAVTVTSKGYTSLQVIQVNGTGSTLIVTSAPSTPYKLTAGIDFTFAITNYFNHGFCLRESATGKILGVFLNSNGATSPAVAIYWAKWTNPSTISTNGSVVSVNGTAGRNLVFRVANDGTNVSVGFSVDGGQTFYTLLSEAKATFFTTAPDQYGVMMNKNNSVLTNDYATVWDVTQS